MESYIDLAPACLEGNDGCDGHDGRRRVLAWGSARSSANEANEARRDLSTLRTETACMKMEERWSCGASVVVVMKLPCWYVVGN